MTTAPHHYDVIVVGGGPAGSTAGALLAANGRDVLILEKEKFPRYHIGESLMPYCYFTFARLGVLEQLKARAFVEKYSVQFVGRDGKVSTPFYFFQHFDHPAAKTWQVPRAEFDQMLLENARTKGAEVREGSAVAETGGKGQGFGLSAGGGGVGATLDVANFCCPEYLSTMLDLINRNWSAKQQARGTTYMRFVIQKDGRIADATVERSSGDAGLDYISQRALVLTKLPPLPAGYDQQALTVHLIFPYGQ